MADSYGDRQPPTITSSAVLRLLPPAARHVLRGAAPVLDTAGDALGLSLSMPACRASMNAALAALWLGPDERLLLGEDDSAADTSNRIARALGDRPHSLVDVSHRQLGLAISGAHAATVLAAGCPLDLDHSAFPVGMCTRTVLGKAEIVLWRIAEDDFHLEVWRSFAAYVSGVIAEAARELPLPELAVASGDRAT
jgi:sarcosine oxidase, subunit gamma